MKANIDLTENRVFRATSESVSIGIVRPTRIPWVSRLANIFSDYLVGNNELVATGNRKEREQKELNKSVFGGEKDCDCCGELINRLPWTKYTGLCSKCDTDMDSKMLEIWWLKEEFEDKLNLFDEFI